MEIVKNGQPTAVIVTAADAPKMVQFAASELQTYIHKISGAKLPITSEKPSSGNVIYVGESIGTQQLGLSVKGLKPDGFRIQSGANWLAFIGRETEPSYGIFNPLTPHYCYHDPTGISKMGETGALYAVYHFLESICGVRWFMPGELGEVVPQSRNISVGNVSISKAPAFSYRTPYFSEFALAGDDEALWYRRTGFGAAHAVTIIHSFLLLNKYRNEHPEYFAIIDGERDYDRTCVGNGSLCLSEPATLTAFVNEARSYFDKNPGAYVFPVMPNDGWEHICECDRCRGKDDESMGAEGKHSDYLWGFVNKVAIELNKTHPGKMVGCCAYEHYMSPPKNIKHLAPNVAVMICKTRYMYWDKKTKEDTTRFIKQWSSACQTLYVWEYYLYASGYDLSLRGLPVFIPKLIADDLKRLKNVSQGEFVECESWCPGLAEPQSLNRPELITPNMYITGKLYWDVTQNPKKLMDDYCTKFYGPAAKQMNEFWQYAEHIWCDVDTEKRKPIALASPEDCGALYTQERLHQMMAYLSRAIAQTKQNTPERLRIEHLKSQIEPAVKRLGRLQKPELKIPFTSVPPTVDGSLNDACWKSAVKFDFSDIMGEDAKYRTTGYALWDDANLYLAFENEDPSIAGMRTLQSKRDAFGTWDDEGIELFFVLPEQKQGEYYQLIITAAGNIWDAYFQPRVTFPDKWDSKCIVKTQTKENKWILEMSIPLQDIGLAYVAGKQITANFYRNRNNSDTKGGASWCAWSPSMSSRHYEPSRFGSVSFVKDSR